MTATRSFSGATTDLASAGRSLAQLQALSDEQLAWAVGKNVIALPITAGTFEPSLGLQLRPEWAAIAMSGSSFIVATNALLLKRLPLPQRPDATITDTDSAVAVAETAAQNA